MIISIQHTLTFLMLACCLPASAIQDRQKSELLTYEWSVDDIQRSIVKGGEDLETVLSRSTASLQRRLDGMAFVERTEATAFTVRIDPAREPDHPLIQRLITTVGKFEIRDVASDDDMRLTDRDKEAQRLRDWLAKKREEGGPITPPMIDSYNRLHLPDSNVMWSVRWIKPDQRWPETWGAALSKASNFPGTAAPAFDDEDWNSGNVPDSIRKRPPTSQSLIECILVKSGDAAFSDADIVRGDVKTLDGLGAGCALVQYEFTPESAPRFSDWSAKREGRCVAYILDGVVLMAPVIGSRLGAVGGIPASSSESASVIAAALRHPIAGRPRLR